METNQTDHNQNIHIVTIDGPAGAGKSTVAKSLAKILKFFYLDTGAMYRALTLKAMSKKIDLTDGEALAQLARDTEFGLENHPDGIKVLLDGKDVTLEIRRQDVTNNTFYISQTPRVRKVMVKWQRKIGGKENIVIEGRDTGTVVFPNAAHKFYLDADLHERSKRRAEELKKSEKPVDIKQLTEELKLRDHKDKTRDSGPLKKADDAILIDTTGLAVDQTVEKILEYMKHNS